jgi:predicted ATPase
VATATTRQVGGQLFTYHELGPVTPNGAPYPTTAWRVPGPRTVASRSEALYDGKSPPMVGRVAERTLLLHAWQQVKSGEGRVVLLTGEPGIGKTRLLGELEAWLAADRHASLRYFCSPLHQGSALHPVIAHREQEAGFARGDTAKQRLDKLEAILAPGEFSAAEIALLAGMLGMVPKGERRAQPDLGLARRRQRTFAVLHRYLANLALRQPVLMLVEDVHWADHSSLEWLNTLVGQITEYPVLLVISFRPEFSPSWIGHAGVSLITLTRLDRRQATALALQVAEERALPPAIVERIIERTDGVPLFVEEMTKAILETALHDSCSKFAVPNTLQGLFMERLDRLGLQAKHIAQTGAAIGREFGFELLASVTDLTEPQLREALDRLTTAGLVFVSGTPPQSHYLFKHVLLQEAAYSTLLSRRRQQLHNRISATLEARFPETVRTQPTLLAQHCAAAGLAEQAVSYWLRAGQQALAVSAMAEAVAQLRKGLDMLAGLADGPLRQQQELDLQSALGAALIATKGPAAADVGETLARARALAEQLDRTRSCCRWSWANGHFILCGASIGCRCRWPSISKRIAGFGTMDRRNCWLASWADTAASSLGSSLPLAPFLGGVSALLT